MQKKADVRFKNDKFEIIGDLDFSNVMFIYQKSLVEMQKSPQLVFDFVQCRSCNSAGLALIIEWIKHSQQWRKPIQFLHLPPAVISLAEAAGMTHLPHFLL